MGDITLKLPLLIPFFPLYTLEEPLVLQLCFLPCTDEKRKEIPFAKSSAISPPQHFTITPQSPFLLLVNSLPFYYYCPCLTRTQLLDTLILLYVQKILDFPTFPTKFYDFLGSLHAEHSCSPPVGLP